MASRTTRLVVRWACEGSVLGADRGSAVEMGTERSIDHGAIDSVQAALQCVVGARPCDLADLMMVVKSSKREPLVINLKMRPVRPRSMLC